MWHKFSRGFETASGTEVITDERIRLFLDTVRIANLLIELGRPDPFRWGRPNPKEPRMMNRPDPGEFRSEEGFIVQTAEGKVKSLLCPWGIWRCFEDETLFELRKLSPHLQLVRVPDQELPQPLLGKGSYHYVSHLEGEFLEKPAIKEVVDENVWAQLLREWHALMEMHGVLLP